MSRSLKFNFSQSFDGVIWNSRAATNRNVLLLEIRNAEKKQVSFAAFDYRKNTFLWRDKSFDEPWWVNLSAVYDDIVLYTLYLETNNPDRKALLAYSLADHKMLWWSNDFSLTAVSIGKVKGFSSKLSKEVMLDIQSGNVVENGAPFEPILALGNQVKPFQYADDMEHFTTVQTFLHAKLNLLPVVALEYLEHDSLIFISYNVTENGLVNYLLVLSLNGDVLLHEKLDEPQKGIGLDTFFILNGCLFFVKNRRELVSYSIV